MSTQSSSWYIPGAGKQPAGPFTAEQLIQDWRAGRLGANTICWREGMAQWLPLSQVEPFASAIRQATGASQVIGDSTTSRPLPTTQPSQSIPSVRQADQIGTTSRVPIALRLLTFALSLVVVVAIGMAYMLTKEPQGKDPANTSPREMGYRSPYKKPASSKMNTEVIPINEKKTYDTGQSTHTFQPDPRTGSSKSADEEASPQSKAELSPSTIQRSPMSAGGHEREHIAGVRTTPRFTEPPLECSCPCWSPDGKYVMFVAPWVGAPVVSAQNRVLRATGPRNIWVVATDGSKRWLVSNFFGGVKPPSGRRSDPLQLDVALAAWSSDGRKIAFSVGRYQVYVMNADATDIYQLADTQGWGSGHTLQWAPDGKGVLFDGHSGFCIHKLDGTASLPLAIPGGGTLTQPCISPNGSSVAGIVEDGAKMGLCVMSKDLRRIKWLTRRDRFGGLSVTFSPRSWSPDAKQIVVHGNNLTLDMFVAIVNVTTGRVRRLTEGAAPSWSPDGKWIAFEGGIGDRGNIYLIGPDGKNLRRITNLTPPGVCMVWGSQPRCSPDGKQIVFRRGEHVWAANLDGSGETCVVQGTDYSRGHEHAPSWPCKWAPFWKQDGSVVFARYFKRDYPVEIEVCATAVNGVRARRVFVWKSPTVAAKSPDDPDDVCWSPDGTKIAFDNNQNIWVAKGDGTGQKRLVGGRSPQWSPDSKKILFARGSQYNEVLCVVNADGSNQIQITDPSDGYQSHHNWCPDGKTVAFEGKNGLFIVPAGGGNARQLVWGQQPCWSPDGQKLAFCAMGRLTSDSGASGPPCVYVMNADGTEMRPVMQVDSTAYGNNLVSYLSWSADGKHLIFEETARRGYDYENLHHIWIVDVSEPVFYQSSYVASELPAWKVPQFEPAPQPGSSETGEEEARTPEAKQLPPADEKPADQGPLTGTWQASTTGERFRIDDDGKTVTIKLEVAGRLLQEFTAKLTRREKAPKFLDGDATVIAIGVAGQFTTKVTGIVGVGENRLRLRCLGGPRGVFNIPLTHEGGVLARPSGRPGRLDTMFPGP